MEGMVTSPDNTPFLDVRGMRVLVTGHTGFKGAWLCEWLLQRGAQVAGVALPPEHQEVLFTKLRLERRVSHAICDIRDAEALRGAVRQADPEVIFHLAAQALVRRSYREPLLTWETNVGGTLNLLEAAAALKRRVTVVVVTTDKVYRNREWEFPYREEDELGGHDPYSASKAACELAVASWRSSFSSREGVTVVTARAGNVVGGGDVCEDRIVPDCYRAWGRGDTLLVRNPKSTRPWQHVLEPLSGYLCLAAHAHTHGAALTSCNFGPGSEGHHTVEDLVKSLAAFDDGRKWKSASDTGVHEARSLSLAIDRARHVLGWTPKLTFEETMSWTDAGYRAASLEMAALVERQVGDYESRCAPNPRKNSVLSDGVGVLADA